MPPTAAAATLEPAAVRFFASEPPREHDGTFSNTRHHFRSRSREADAARAAAGSPPPEPERDATEAAEAAGSTTGQHAAPTEDYTMPHPPWTPEELADVQITHTPPRSLADKLAYNMMRLLKVGFDVVSGFKFGKHTEQVWLTRIIFLETVAGVPGMVAAGLRHLKSLRRMQRDSGWIHTLLEDAENERMHLLTALSIRKPGPIFRALVIGGQAVFVTFFFTSYLISPAFCHRFVAYLEETAVGTYTDCLKELDAGQLPVWSETPAPEIAMRYWRLPEGAMMRDVIANIRADEMHHREIHHTFADLSVTKSGDRDPQNPFTPGQGHMRGRQ